MKAVVLDGFGGLDALVFKDIPKPEPKEGTVVIRIKAFGINHAEMHMRRGEWAEAAPVSGIECVGIVDSCPGGEFAVGAKVAALIGGLGRTINGSYAEYTRAPVSNVAVSRCSRRCLMLRRCWLYGARSRCIRTDTSSTGRRCTPCRSRWLARACGSSPPIRSYSCFHRHELVATHPRLRKPGDRHTVRDHQPPAAQAWLEHDPQWCLARAEEIGPSCHALVLAMFNDTVLVNLRGAQGIVRMREKFGDQRLDAACERALAFASPKYRTVKTILDKGLDSQPAAAQTSAAPADTYLNGGRFGRDLHSLLLH